MVADMDDPDKPDKPEYEPKPLDVEPLEPVPPSDTVDAEYKHDWSGFAEPGRPGAVDELLPPSFETTPAQDDESDESYSQEVGDGAYDDEIRQAHGDGEELDSLVGRFGDYVYRLLGIPKPTPMPHIPEAERESMDRVFGRHAVLTLSTVPDDPVIVTPKQPVQVPPGQVSLRSPQPLDGCLDLTHAVDPGIVRSVPDDVTDAVLAALKSVTADVDAELEPIQERRRETMREIVLRIVVRRAYTKAKGVGADKYVNAVRDGKLDSYVDVVKAAIDVLDMLEDLLGASDPTLRVTLRKLQIRKEKGDRR